VITKVLSQKLLGVANDLLNCIFSTSTVLIWRRIKRCDVGTGNTERPLLAVPVVQGNQAVHLVQGCLEYQVGLADQGDHHYHGFHLYQVDRVVL